MKLSRTAVLALVFAVLPFFLSFPESEAQEFLFEWGQAGTADGQFTSPSGIAIDSTGSVYVTDTGNNRIQKFDGQGAFLLKWGSPGGGAGQFNSPRGVAVDSLNNVYVVDSGNQRIQKFSSNGAFITAWGSAGSGAGRFNQPSGVAVDSQNNVYVTDTGNDRVQKFGGNGGFIASWGTTGDGVGQFRSPQAVTAWMPGDGADLIYVGDANSRIQAFDPDGTYVLELGGVGEQDGQFNGVGGIGVVDYELFASDAGNHRMQEFGYNGGFSLKWGIFGRDNGRFTRPAGVAAAGSATFVVDMGNDRVQAFGPLLPAGSQLDTNYLSFSLSRSNFRTLESAGMQCAYYGDTTQNAWWPRSWWPTALEMTSEGKTYTGFQTGTAIVLSTTYANGARIVSEQLELTQQSTSRATGTLYVSESDASGNFCISEADADLAGSTPVVPPPVTPVQGDTGLLGGNIGGGGCFIVALSR